MFFSQTSGVNFAWTRSVPLVMFWSVRHSNLSSLISNLRFLLLKDKLYYDLFHPFRLRPSECRECCSWFSLNSAIFHFSEVCRQKELAQDSGVIGYVLHTEEKNSQKFIMFCKVCCVLVSVGLVGWGVERGCVLPGDSRRLHVWVYMSVCDLPVCVDVSITPGCCWCSLLLFEVSAAAGCLAFWFCDSLAKKKTHILTLCLSIDLIIQWCFFNLILMMLQEAWEVRLTLSYPFP